MPFQCLTLMFDNDTFLPNLFFFTRGVYFCHLVNSFRKIVWKKKGSILNNSCYKIVIWTFYEDFKARNSRSFNTLKSHFKVRSWFWNSLVSDFFKVRKSSYFFKAVIYGHTKLNGSWTKFKWNLHQILNLKKHQISLIWTEKFNCAPTKERCIEPNNFFMYQN
jgi:hypothetical protein